MKNDLRPEHLNQEVTVVLPLSVVLRIADEPKTAAPIAQGVARALPAIGDDYEGGKFAGITLDGDQLAALVLLPGDFNGDWKDSTDWADKEGGTLPTRHDQMVLFKNMKSEFKEAYYWSCEQHAAVAGCAWGQYFSNGFQGWGDVSYRDRARAVRRIPIR